VLARADRIRELIAQHGPERTAHPVSMMCPERVAEGRGRKKLAYTVANEKGGLPPGWRQTWKPIEETRRYRKEQRQAACYGR
jgi:hypothetical protein